MSYPEHSGHRHYVTVRSGDRTAVLAGPFRTRQDAEARESDCRRIVREKYRHDMAATFAEIGTTRVMLRPGQRGPLGGFNALLGVES